MDVSLTAEESSAIRKALRSYLSDLRGRDRRYRQFRVQAGPEGGANGADGCGREARSGESCERTGHPDPPANGSDRRDVVESRGALIRNDAVDVRPRESVGPGMRVTVEEIGACACSPSSSWSTTTSGQSRCRVRTIPPSIWRRRHDRRPIPIHRRTRTRQGRAPHRTRDGTAGHRRDRQRGRRAGHRWGANGPGRHHAGVLRSGAGDVPQERRGRVASRRREVGDRRRSGAPAGRQGALDAGLRARHRGSPRIRARPRHGDGRAVHGVGVRRDRAGRRSARVPRRHPPRRSRCHGVRAGGGDRRGERAHRHVAPPALV